MAKFPARGLWRNASLLGIELLWRNEFREGGVLPIARSLGAASSSRVITNVDYHTVGLLPVPGGANYTDACAGSFSAPEVERDLLKVPNTSLIEEVNFHAASVSFILFSDVHSIDHFSYLL
jgi:hypothetical protein